VVCWHWLGCWSNNFTNNHPSPGPFNHRVVHCCVVPQCSHPLYWTCHQRRLANCDWIHASYTSRQSSHSRRHSTCWASSQWSRIASRTSYYGAWTSAPLSAHPSNVCKCMAPQIETPIYLYSPHNNSSVCLKTTIHVWRSGWITNEMRSGRTTLQDTTLSSPTSARHPHSCPPKNSVAASAPCRTLPLLFVQMEYCLFWGLWVWCRRKNRQPCCPPMSNPSTSSWTARPEGFGWWDNRTVAPHFRRDLVRPGSGLKNWLKKEKETAIRFLLNVFHAFASNNVVNHSKTFKRYFQHKKKTFKNFQKVLPSFQKMR